MTTDWRTPDSPLDEVRYRLTAFKFPSFDRTVVEALMAEIESLDKARKANVETCVAYAKRIEELRQQVGVLTAALREIAQFTSPLHEAGAIAREALTAAPARETE